MVGRPAGREFPIKLQTHITEEMDKEIEEAMKLAGDKKPDFIRKAIRRHIDLIKEWAEGEQKP